MMKKTLFTLVLLAVLPVLAMAQADSQKDPKAKAILDKVSATTKSYSSMYIEFSYRIVNKQSGIDESQDGKVWIKGDKYKMIFPGIQRYSDGKTLWTFMEDDDECMINNANGGEEEDEGDINPSELMTIYESGFNYQYGSQETVNGKTTDMIKLYPQGGTKPYHTVKLYIDRATNHIARVEIMGKDGNTISYDVLKISTNETMPDSMFIFDTSKAGDVIDLRD